MRDEIQKQICNKKMRIKLDIKIKWNQMFKDKIEKQNLLKKSLKAKQITIKRIMIKINTNWHNTFNFWKGRRKTRGEKRENKEKKKNSLLKPPHRLCCSQHHNRSQCLASERSLPHCSKGIGISLAMAHALDAPAIFGL